MKKIKVSFLLGVLTGILLSPDKGIHTRRKIKAAWQSLWLKVNRTFEQVTTKIETVAEAIDEKVERFNTD